MPRPARVGQGHRIFLEPRYKFPANPTMFIKNKNKNMGYL